MKHIFIINPNAGIKSSVDSVIENINKFKDKYNIETLVTNKKGQNTAFVKDYLEKHKDEEVRFYACGGDGTLNDIVNGIYGYKNASITAYPCGSGDDFVKSVGGRTKYNDIEKLLNAKNTLVDVIKINDKYCLNVCNFGFDAIVCKYANLLKGTKCKSPYGYGIRKAVFGGMNNKITVVADGEVINPNGRLLLCSLANGAYYGGKYKCAPNYVLDDGIMELCYVKPVSLFRFIKLIGLYEIGEHLSNKKFAKIIKYRRVKNVNLYGPKDFDVCVDGEMLYGNKFEISIIQKAINFAIPE